MGGAYISLSGMWDHNHSNLMQCKERDNVQEYT